VRLRLLMMRKIHLLPQTAAEPMEHSAQSATMDNPYLQHLMINHHGAATITSVHGHPEDIGGGGDSVYGPGPMSPIKETTDGPEAFYNGQPPKIRKLKKKRRRSRKGNKNAKNPMSFSPRSRGASALSEAMSELSDVTATTLNSDSDDTAEGSDEQQEDQPLTYPTDKSSLCFTSSLEHDTDPEPIAERLEHNGGFHAVPAGDHEICNLSDITSMDGDRDFETVL